MRTVGAPRLSERSNHARRGSGIRGGSTSALQLPRLLRQPPLSSGDNPLDWHGEEFPGKPCHCLREEFLEKVCHCLTKRFPGNAAAWRSVLRDTLLAHPEQAHSAGLALPPAGAGNYRLPWLGRSPVFAPMDSPADSSNARCCKGRPTLASALSRENSAVDQLNEAGTAAQTRALLTEAANRLSFFMIVSRLMTRKLVRSRGL